MTDQEQVAFLTLENAQLREQIAILTAKVALLLDLIQKQGVKKDSHNSGLPPSGDLSPKLRSLRPKSDRPSGGQMGHKGETLKMSEAPDSVVELKSEFCQKCGQSLADVSFRQVSRRQVVDIPPVQPLYEEYRQYACDCPNCGGVQKADYPAGVNAPVQYGPQTATLVSYLSVYQYVPYHRITKLFAAVFGLQLSQGTIDNLLNKGAQKARLVYEQIRQSILQSAMLGSDETSAKVNGSKWWIWVWENLQNTFIAASDPDLNRDGSATIDRHLKTGFPKVALVSDRWAAQLKTVALYHQLCLAHLQRDAIYLQEAEKHAFADDFLQLLRQSLQFRKELLLNNQAAAPEHETAQDLEKQLNDLLAQTIDADACPKTATFQISIIKYRNYIFPFLYNLEIPPDNNGSERAIRNIRVKQKISGRFKSGQHTFCVLRSVIDTFIKRQIDVFKTLRQIMTLQLE